MTTTQTGPSPFYGANVMVTGGLGFIGSRLALRLVALGARVTLVDLLAPDTGANATHRLALDGAAEIHIGDIRESETVSALVRGKDYVFNLAALIGHMDSMLRPHADMEINVGAQLTLLEACRHVNPDVRIVHTSTRQVYGRADQLPVGEDHPFRPPDVNGVNKLAGEFYHALYHRVYGTRSTVLRLSNVYGPGMRIRDGRQTFIGLWIRCLIEGAPFEVWGGSQLRDLVYVDDVVDAILATAASDACSGEVFNVGGYEPMSLRALAELLVEVGGGAFAAVPYPGDRLPIEIGSFITDSRKINSALGWEASTSLRTGLKRTLEYYATHLGAYV